MIFAMILAVFAIGWDIHDIVHHDAPSNLTLKGYLPPKSESWDQENLKRNDVGCPTAVFIAPNGVLQQCEP